MADYKKTFADLIKNSALFRHIINKFKTRKKGRIVFHDGTTLEDVELKSFDYYLKMIEVVRNKRVYFINLRWVKYIETEHTDLDEDWREFIESTMSEKH
jgi:hypothetical protein